MGVPEDDIGDETAPCEDGWPTRNPTHSAFGPESIVKVPVPKEIMASKGERESVSVNIPEIDDDFAGNTAEDMISSKRSRRKVKEQVQVEERIENTTRRPVRDR